MQKQLSMLAIFPLFLPISGPPSIGEQVMAQREFSLDNRYPDKWVNEVFKYNILLTLDKLGYQFTLDPNKTFAFHDDVESKYKNSLVKTTNAHFNAQDGFKSDGYLFGDGVCHLASLLYWVAKDAGLETEAPTRHDFANIPEVPKEYGVSIYSNPASKGINTKQNLYITNNKDKQITFKFEYRDQKVKVSVLEKN